MRVDLGIYKFRGRQKLPESLGPGFGDSRVNALSLR
jgi:hypothetical protein